MISKLHYITQDVADRTHAQLAEQACAAGAEWIQLRVKNKSSAEWKEIAVETQQVCKKYGAKLIINDSMTLARDINADGVHLGLNDLSTSEARRALGPDFIIGGTANTFEDIRMHAAGGVNYVGVGPFRFTTTKDKLSPILGLEGYNRIIETCRKERIRVPVIAIGGILPEDVAAITRTGVYGVAVSSVITNATDKKLIISQFKELLNGSTTVHA